MQAFDVHFLSRLQIFRYFDIQMITDARSRKKGTTYIELKSSNSFKQKMHHIQKLGGSIKASIDKLQRFKTEILSSNNIKELAMLINAYQKQNDYFNQLQISLKQIDEDSSLLAQVNKMNLQFIQNHHPEELTKKFEYMKREMVTHREDNIEMEQVNQNNGLKSVLIGDKHTIRSKILQQQLQELREIQKLVAKVKQIALDTSTMILAQGIQLQIAGTNMKSAKAKLKQGTNNLSEANQYQQDTNKKLMGFCLIVVVIVLIIIMIIWSSHSKTE